MFASSILHVCVFLVSFAIIKTFISCGFRKCENVFTYEYHIPLGHFHQGLIWDRHNLFQAVACKWCVPSASDVFLSKNDNSGEKTRDASEMVEYDFYFMEYDFCPVWSRVLISTHCSEGLNVIFHQKWSESHVTRTWLWSSPVTLAVLLVLYAIIWQICSHVIKI
jgi:hypothetical protein